MGLELNFSIDPRTKIIILAILSFIVFNDAPLYVNGILVLIPFICLFLSDHKKTALIYILIYVIAKFLQTSILPTATGILSVLLIAFSYTATKMFPILMMGYYTISTTKVSEFIASMEKSNVPKDIIIPISVIFRYIPSVYEEIRSITDAMKMRGFGLTLKSLKSPLKLIEFYMIPILISAVKTADELSAASLTRGLSNPQKRTHLISANFSKFDYVFILIAVVGLGVYAYYSFGGAIVA